MLLRRQVRREGRRRPRSLALLELVVDAVEQLGWRSEAGETADLVVHLFGASVEGEELQRSGDLHRVVVEDRVQYRAEPVELGVGTAGRELVTEAEEPSNQRAPPRRDDAQVAVPGNGPQHRLRLVLKDDRLGRDPEQDAGR